MQHKIHQPAPSQSEFIERFWMVTNPTIEEHKVVIIPDGRIDLVFTTTRNEPFTSHLIGIETEPTQHTVTPGTIIMGAGLKLLAVEYCLKYSVAPFLDKSVPLNSPFLGKTAPLTFPTITPSDLHDFPSFCQKLTSAFTPLIPPTIDKRKQTLFDTLYNTQGSLKIQEYAEKCFWTSRQINRYFTEWFGLSLKEYCSILRFRASIDQIKEGKFFPELNYSDQPHFIREVKKFTGVTPKELFKRQHDRFIQLRQNK